MPTSVKPSTTSQPPAASSTKIIPVHLRVLPSSPASPPMATTSASKPSSTASTMILKDSLVSRERFLIRHGLTGQYLAGAADGQLIWSDDPLQAFRYTLMETACEQLRATREFYKIPEVEIASIVFQIDPSFPERMTAGSSLI